MMDREEFAARILTRRSVREYDGKPVPREELERILLAGACAPSAHDSRPWQFVVCETLDARKRLQEALQQKFCRDMEKSGFSAEEISARLQRSTRIFSSAPVLIVAFAQVVRRENPLARNSRTEQVMAVQSVSLAAGQMMLMASGLGLGMCWFAAPLFCPQEVCVACGCDPAQWEPQCLLTLGYPAGEPKEKKPPVVDEVTVYL